MIGDQCGAVAYADVAGAGFPNELIEVVLVVLVERAGRLIEEGEFRLTEKQAGESDALLLAEREHVIPFHHAVEIAVHTFEHVG